jgi:hypothetical protein
VANANPEPAAPETKAKGETRSDKPERQTPTDEDPPVAAHRANGQDEGNRPGLEGSEVDPARVPVGTTDEMPDVACAKHDPAPGAVLADVETTTAQEREEKSPKPTADALETAPKGDAAFKPKVAEEPQTPPASQEVAPLSEYLSASELARRLNQPAARVETFLRRYREKHLDCAVTVDSRCKNEPRYLYRSADVLPALKQRLLKWGRLTDG